MERVRQIAAVAAAVALSGCAATDRLSAHYLDARRTVGLDPASARPATHVSLMMQRRLASLPDPTRPDAMQPGLPGQLFLAAADGRAVAANGDLIVTVTDDTPRPPGQPPKTTEKWQFNRDVLEKLRQKDDRFGDCYVLFLPWPADWKDVSRVTVKGQYQAAGQVVLHASEVTISLETGTQAMPAEWQKAEPFKAPPFDGKPAVAGPPPAQTEPILLPPPALLPLVQPQPGTPGIVVPQTPAPVGPLVPQTVEIRRS